MRGSSLSEPEVQEIASDSCAVFVSTKQGALTRVDFAEQSVAVRFATNRATASEVVVVEVVDNHRTVWRSGRE